MNKGTIKTNVKPIQDRNRTQAVHWVAANTPCTTAYVYGVLSGTYKNGKALEILEAYRAKYAELNRVLS